MISQNGPTSTSNPNANTSPTIVISHGAWHTPEHMQPLIGALESRGFPTICPRAVTASDDGSERWDITVEQDSENLRKVVLPLLDEGKDVILLGHSYGGNVISEASMGLSVQERKSKGLKGGVTGLVYMCAFMLSEGTSLADSIRPVYPPEWMDVMPDGRILAPRAAPYCYNDLSEEECTKWGKFLTAHSTEAMESKITHAGWKNIPATYLACESDLMIPYPVQQMFIQSAKDTGADIRVETLTAGHSPWLSQLDNTVDIIVRSANSTKQTEPLA